MEQTFALIKPLAFQKNLTGSILHKIAESGFYLRAVKSIHLNRNQAIEFYRMHQYKPFFVSLIEYITSGPVVIMILEKENAVEELRKLVGDTDPHKALEGTLRNLFGVDKQKNSIHASDSIENAKREMELCFSKLETA